MDDLKQLSKLFRLEILDIVYHSKAGHIGGDFSVIDILNVLYNRVMHIDPFKFDNPNRDRLILSKAHCAEALYVCLAYKGFFPYLELEKTYSTFGSIYNGHPNKEVKGVEICGGSLGHGLSVAVGMALAGKLDKRSYKTYVVLGDGEMEEGSNYEAMMAASQYHLDNLIAIVDHNKLQISGPIKDVMNSDDLAMKFKSFHWDTYLIEDGNNLDNIIEVFNSIKPNGKPILLLAETIKGKGVSFMENQAKWHHGVLTKEEYEQAKEEIKHG